jgi:20S proteasome alpha/beta subunit
MAAITLSDRMVTADDVQYEPQQLKVAFITQRTIIMIAGEYPVHSQALIATSRQVRNDPSFSPRNIAMIYGQALQSVKQKQAEDYYLAPIGLNTETFLAQQRDMSEGFVDTITNQLQNFRGPQVEALAVRIEDERAHIYEIDKYGTVSCYDDIGFAAIGIGAWHAKSRLMQVGYVNSLTLAPTLAATFAAKKAAEIAPGIGKMTDIHLVTKDAIFPLWTALSEKMTNLYKDYNDKVTDLQRDAISHLEAFLNEIGPKTPPPAGASEGEKKEGQK